AGIHRRFAIAELRPLAGSTAVGIRLTNDDGFTFQLRIRGDDLKAGVDRAELIGDAHLHMTIGKLWRALGMKGNKIERRTLRAGRVIRTLQTVLEKVTHELSAAPGGIGTTNPRRRQRPAHTRNRKVVELTKFLR